MPLKYCAEPMVISLSFKSAILILFFGHKLKSRKGWLIFK